MNNYHLTKQDDQWKLTREGAGRATEVFTGTKQDAVQQSAQRLAGSGASLKIHLENGRIQEERTYPRSADPRNSKG